MYYVFICLSECNKIKAMEMQKYDIGRQNFIAVRKSKYSDKNNIKKTLLMTFIL